MKILLVRLSSLGDAVLATAALEALLSQRPDLKADVLTKPAFAQIFESHPAVGRVVVWENGDSASAVAARLRPAHYDFVFDLHRNLRTRLLRLFLRGPKWVVYQKGAVRRRIALLPGLKWLLGGAHVTARYVNALSELGIKGENSLPRLYPSRGDMDSALEILSAGGWDGKKRVIALAPGARWATKRWPAQKWAELACELSAKGDFFFAVIGGQEDLDAGEKILTESKADGTVLAGDLSILQTAALFSRCAVLISNDSAPAHIATASGLPVVAVFGPTVRDFGFYPRGPRDEVVEVGLSCRPCSLHGGDSCPRGHFDCMMKIDAKIVAEAALKAAGLAS